LNNYAKLETLDLSWNKLGGNYEIFKRVCANMQTNSTLIHLDLSHNNNSSKELTELSNNIKDNHTLLGLHLTGNEAKVDGAGYINTFKSPLMITSHYSIVCLEN